MQFNENAIFHIYNQGNNRQQVFYKDAHYLDFLGRMRQFLLPHVDFLAYCLMPNHFHFLVYVKQIEAFFPITQKTPTGRKKIGESSRTLNLSIGVLLRSYTNYLNKNRGTSGSVFRQKTKAKEDWIDDFITVDHPAFMKESNYGLTCFQYIHKNPKDIVGLTALNDWPYSSYPDYCGQRNGTLCNKELAVQLLGIDLENFKI